MMKTLFFGTPQIAVPYLDWLSQHTTVVGVVCRPDEPVGRGYKITAPPTKVFAETKKIPVYQPAGPWTEQTAQAFKSLNADLGIVIAYGRILPRTIFMAPKLGCINIHFSLLPKFRGAAPMQWALINGESKTGVSAFWLEEGMDSGPVFHQAETPILADDNATSLREKLVPLGISVLERVVRDVEARNILRHAQQGEPTYAPLLKKEHGRINWALPAATIVNLVRGVCEWPGATTTFSVDKGAPRQLKILGCAEFAHRKNSAAPGTVSDFIKDKGIVVSAGDGLVLVRNVQPEGKKAMPASAFWQGAHLKIGDKLG